MPFVNLRSISIMRRVASTEAIQYCEASCVHTSPPACSTCCRYNALGSASSHPHYGYGPSSVQEEGKVSV